MKRKTKILIVDDRLPVRETIKNILSGLDYTFVEATKGEKALSLIEKSTFDVIILDLKLPGIDGIETLQRAKKIRPNLAPVIILTAHPDIATAKAAFKLEAFDYLLKNSLASDAVGEIAVFEYIPKDSIDAEKLRSTVIKAASSNYNFTHPCYMHNVHSCLHNTPVQRDVVFVGMSFSTNDIYEYGIKPTIESLGLKSWRADADLRIGPISCKICATLQSCTLAIMDLSGWNANVCFEVGLAYGYGKKVILLKNEDTERPPTNLAGILYLPYTNIDSLKKILTGSLKANL